MPIYSNNGNKHSKQNILCRRNQLSRTIGTLNPLFHSTNPRRNLPLCPVSLLLKLKFHENKEEEKSEDFD